MYNKEEFKNEMQEMLVEMFPDMDSSLISVTVNGKAQEGFRLDKTGEDTSPIFLRKTLKNTPMSFHLLVSYLELVVCYRKKKIYTLKERLKITIVVAVMNVS